MGNSVKIKASATSRTGLSKTANNNNFYMNGRFIYEYETENIQVSIENNEDFYIFAVSDSMDVSDAEKQVHISIARELKKYHDKVGTSEENLSQKVETLGGLIQGMSNLLTSVSVNSPEDAASKASFSGLLIQGNQACLLNLGTCKAYILRNGSIKQLTTDWEKTERLLKLGIITNEQARELSSRFGIPTEDNLNEIRKTDKFTIKEGDVFLLCTKSLTDIVEAESIYDILHSDMDTGFIANRLVNEAFKNGAEDNITTIVIRVEKTSSSSQLAPQSRKGQKKFQVKPSYRGKINIPYIGSVSIKTLKKYASLAALCLIIIALIFGTIKLASGISKRNKLVGNQETVNNNANTTTSNDSSTKDNGKNGTTGEENNEQNNSTDESNTGTDIETQDNTGILPAKYQVKKGDTLYNISNMFYNTPDNYKIIMEENNIDDPTKIQIGQILNIPEVND
ncbi:MAG TPA: LysM peptidoglycan-binding domain-containing protein [Clostridiaceae bacterium]|jgi:serine/threonine protein phosphatase PrpC/LysM repeat protein|nr:LysM peptidoglycan-binding domain-containing protein [Clostridiaceae bacterium]